LNPGLIYLWYFDPGFNFPYGILTPGSIAHVISTPLPMVYQTLSYGIMNFFFGRNEGGFNLPWGGSKYNDKKLTPGSKYLGKDRTLAAIRNRFYWTGMTENLKQWCLDCHHCARCKPGPGLGKSPLNRCHMVNWTRGQFTYDILTLGSIFLMVKVLSFPKWPAILLWCSWWKIISLTCLGATNWYILLPSSLRKTLYNILSLTCKSSHSPQKSSAGSVLQLSKVSQKFNKPFRRSCAYKVHDPPFSWKYKLN
jgi:hypothetical protein